MPAAPVVGGNTSFSDSKSAPESEAARNKMVAASMNTKQRNPETVFQREHEERSCCWETTHRLQIAQCAKINSLHIPS